MPDYFIMNSETETIMALYICIAGKEDDNMINFLSQFDDPKAFYCDKEGLFKILNTWGRDPNLNDGIARIAYLKNCVNKMESTGPIVYFDGKADDLDEFTKRYNIKNINLI